MSGEQGAPEEVVSWLRGVFSTVMIAAPGSSSSGEHFLWGPFPPCFS